MRFYTGGITAASFFFVALLATTASAGTIQSSGPAYQLRIATDSMLLNDPTSSLAHKSAVWKTPYEILVLRSMPVFLLENKSTGDFNITNLSIDINEKGYVFDTVTLLDGPNGLNPTVVSPTDLVYGGGTTKVANFSFASRTLKAGESFMFSLRIVPDAGFPPSATDFRNILWDPNSSDRSKNALVNVKFDNADLPTASLFSYPFATKQFGLPGDGTKGRSIRFPGMSHNSTDVGLYEFTQTPEPDSFLLASICLSALLFCVRRGKPQMAALRS